jgi:hypothetical protein
MIEMIFRSLNFDFFISNRFFWFKNSQKITILTCPVFGEAYKITNNITLPNHHEVEFTNEFEILLQAIIKKLKN